jgi:hypothetical protein
MKRSATSWLRPRDSDAPQSEGKRAGLGTPGRRFGLLDGMILVVGSAVGFACCRSVIPGSMDPIAGFSALNWTFTAVDAVGFLLMLSSFMVLAMRLRSPRPTIRRVARQPGAAACFAMVAFTTFRLLNVAYDLVTRNVIEYPSIESRVYHWLSPRSEDASTVAIVWMIFAFGRVGRPERSWIDRAGRVVGSCWILWALIGSFMESYLH